jgi:hypothetical protein
VQFKAAQKNRARKDEIRVEGAAGELDAFFELTPQEGNLVFESDTVELQRVSDHCAA